ncbi:uncharacterized protein LOC123548966 [Mercenaria mercenaria]|uniref:uncharacterized protein LOC123548966 n=1 Tax=Mercenaria mercenaria TaxID=6596 RepID=UPI00234F8519|nr:uncharacterized protein LOC123548966 [Mercenaria mercenaria]XP_053401806.1 uncharacterized protein LOC123548966 [Mercenaria mercenaria]
MASEDSSEILESSKRPLELHFVDHVELKIQSPEKEVISPTKMSLKGSNAASLAGVNGKIVNGNASIESVLATADSIKDDQNETKSSDSGVDTSNNSSEIPEEYFIDRQESYTPVCEPEVLKSPDKTVDQLFNFLDSSSSQSLDALNNNSEVILGENEDEKDNVETAQTVDVYLGKEVALHECENGEGQSVENKVTDEGSMNLYWYTSSLDVDMTELEAFKVSQAENKMSENVTSNLEVTVGNGYYKTKNIDVELESSKESVYKSETSFDIKSEPVKRDGWSPAFESASSRILDLASELKSEPKHKKNRENESIRDTVEIDREKHPWGLDGDNKVRSEAATENQDDLPDIGDITSTDKVDGSVDTFQSSAYRSDMKSSEAAIAILKNEEARKAESIEDEADAIGYMELKDRPIEQGIVTSESVQLETRKRLATEEVPEKVSADEQFEDYSEDVADAFGYMEWKDRPVEQVLVTSEPVQLETDMGLTTEDVLKKVSVDEQFEDYPEDVADAIGYMELKDKPVEQVIKASEQGILKASDQGKTEISVTERTDTSSVESIENQIIGQDIKVGISQESKPSMEATSEGMDVPDAQLEAIEKLENQNVQSQIQDSLKEQKAKPFDPFNIKRKYLIANDSEETVQKMGGIFIETETLVDEYLDDKNYSLILNDCWLRLRNKKFEMKVNASFGYGPNKSPSVEMLTNEIEIQDMLMKRYEKTLEQKRRVSERQLDVLIDALGITEFVTFETTRKKYQVEDFIVTMDVTNFGFEVGDIEIVANSLPEMMTDLINMDSLAAKLGFRPLQSN